MIMTTQAFLRQRDTLHRYCACLKPQIGKNDCSSCCTTEISTLIANLRNDCMIVYLKKKKKIQSFGVSHAQPMKGIEWPFPDVCMICIDKSVDRER